MGFLRKLQLVVLAVLSCVPVAHAQAADQTPQANPARPTVSTPATLTPVGYLQFETGALYGEDSPGLTAQMSLNQVTKLAVATRLQFISSWEPVAYSSRTPGDTNSPTEPGGIALGAQAVALPGAGARPTVSLSYFHALYLGTAPDPDIGSARQSALVLVSADFAGFHADINGIANEQKDSGVRRAQFGQTLSVSHGFGRWTVAGELWHFSQPFLQGNAVGNLWALSYAARANLVFDAGFNHALTSTSSQWEGFAGFTYLLPHRLWKTHASRIPHS
jgi:hypothetical protein